MTRGLFGLGVLGSCWLRDAADEFGLVGGADSEADVDRSVSELGDASAAVWVSGVGGSSFPVTTSESQSPIPPGTMSTAVCGEYTEMPWAASRSRVFCCESFRVMDLRPRKMIG